MMRAKQRYFAFFVLLLAWVIQPTLYALRKRITRQFVGQLQRRLHCPRRGDWWTRPIGASRLFQRTIAGVWEAVMSVNGVETQEVTYLCAKHRLPVQLSILQSDKSRFFDGIEDACYELHGHLPQAEGVDARFAREWFFPPPSCFDPQSDDARLYKGIYEAISGVLNRIEHNVERDCVLVEPKDRGYICQSLLRSLSCRSYNCYQCGDMLGLRNALRACKIIDQIISEAGPKMHTCHADAVLMNWINVISYHALVTATGLFEWPSRPQVGGSGIALTEDCGEAIRVHPTTTCDGVSNCGHAREVMRDQKAGSGSDGDFSQDGPHAGFQRTFDWDSAREKVHPGTIMPASSEVPDDMTRAAILIVSTVDQFFINDVALKCASGHLFMNLLAWDLAEWQKKLFCERVHEICGGFDVSSVTAVLTAAKTVPTEKVETVFFHAKGFFTPEMYIEDTYLVPNEAMGFGLLVAKALGSTIF